MLEIGNKAPDFKGLDQNNKEIKLSDFIGKKVALYFYPKDDTPGCTKQACSFRDNFSSLTEKGISVIGVSPDNIESHNKFIKKYELPFTLISDPEKNISGIYDVYREKNMYGKISMGIVRTTFLIDEKGLIVHIFKKPKTEIHAEEVLNKF
ncbi:MAG: thioredoxin-dependent thiol peroxidase [Candidatus Sericytochromatia bacterium]|nr:thioredoxin-dependent thiol peroxidase [Candidatus Sericytochromatia bacterium]